MYGKLKAGICWWPCLLEPRKPRARGGVDDVMLLDLGIYHERKRNKAWELIHL